MKIGTFVGGVLGVAGAVIGGVWHFQERLIYFPGPDPGPPPDHWEIMNVDTEDGLSLSSWIRENPDAESSRVVVVFPGNAGNRAGRLAIGNAIAEAGHCVVLAEYRGYGGNRGRPTEAGLASDARAVVRAAKERCAAADGVVYYGESLGAAVAIALAAQDPPDALILGSPFTSLVDVGRVHYPWLPVELLLHDRYASLERIRRGELSGVPSLVVGGTGDRVVPVEESRAIAEELDAAVFEIDGADHNDASLRSGPTVARRITDFIAANAGR